jgi:sporulation protein YlmC with PRC-barrel domain
MSQSGANQKNANQRDQFSAMGPQRISMIMGQSIKNVDGQDLGKVEDVVIDQNGKITYVILSHGGFLGIGDKLVPIPWNSIAAHGNATQNRNYLMVDMSKDMIEKAPNFETKSWPNFAEGDWSNSVSSYFSRDSWNKDSSSKNAEMKSNSGSNLADRNYSKDTNFNSSTSGSTAVNSDDAAKKAGNTGTPASRGLTESR